MSVTVLRKRQRETRFGESTPTYGSLVSGYGSGDGDGFGYGEGAGAGSAFFGEPEGRGGGLDGFGFPLGDNLVENMIMVNRDRFAS